MMRRMRDWIREELERDLLAAFQRALAAGMQEAQIRAVLEAALRCALANFRAGLRGALESDLDPE